MSVGSGDTEALDGGAAGVELCLGRLLPRECRGRNIQGDSLASAKHLAGGVVGGRVGVRHVVALDDIVAGVIVLLRVRVHDG